MKEIGEVIAVRRFVSRGYEIRTLLFDADRPVNPRKGMPTVELKAAYTLKGDYIGDPKDAYYLSKLGIAPELRTPRSQTCTVGYCSEEKKWYGWSHRAIKGFKTRRAACRFAESVS